MRQLVVYHAQVSDGSAHLLLEAKSPGGIVLHLESPLRILQTVHVPVRNAQLAAELDSLHAWFHLRGGAFQDVLGRLVSPEPSVGVAQLAENQVPISSGIREGLVRLAELDCIVEGTQGMFPLGALSMLSTLVHVKLP